MTNQIKKNQVAAFIELLNQSKNFVLLTFNKTKHQSLENLRKELKKNDSFIQVLKNTLFEKAINKKSQKQKIFSDFRKKFFPLKNTTALLYFKNDWNNGLKSIYDFIQKEKTVEFKSGIIDSEIYESANILKIAQLPGRNELIAKIFGEMKNPMIKFIYSMKYNTQKLIYVLKEKSKEVSN
jgi:large subunit ribosomal protein L10